MVLLVATGSPLLYLEQNSVGRIQHLEKKTDCIEKGPLPFTLKSLTKLPLLLPRRPVWPKVSSDFCRL